MHEAKRFMRYVLPGLVFVVELAVACWLSKALEIPEGFLASLDSWGAIVGVFLSSGALGYIFSTIYFASVFHVNYSNCLTTISMRCNHILMLKPDGNMLCPRDVKELGRKDKFVVGNQIWHWLVGHDEGMRAIESYSEKVNDIMHSVGATFVATLAALFSWVALMLWYPFNLWSCRDWFVLLIWVLLAGVFLWGYWRNRKYYTEFYNSAIITALSATDKLDNGLRIVLISGDKAICKPNWERSLGC